MNKEINWPAVLIWFILILSLVCTLADSARAQQETFVGTCARDYACTLATGVSWANGNQVWRFVPLWPNESIRIFIHNNNTTSAHTQTVSAWLTSSKIVNTLLAGADQWAQLSITDNSVSGAKCANVNSNAPTATPGANGTATCYIIGMFAAQVAIQISGASGQAGSPDTFDLSIVQQQSTYPGGPQPGQDSSIGGNSASQVNLGTNNVFSAATSTAKTLLCEAAGVTAPCNPTVVPTFMGSGSTLNRQQDISSATVITGGAGDIGLFSWNGSGSNWTATSPNNPLPVAIYPANIALTTQADPCRSALPSSVAIVLSSATTTLLVAVSGSTKIFVCSFSFTMVGAVESIKFVYGTQITNPCDTGQTALTGAYADGTVSDIAMAVGGPYTQFVTAASQQLCAVTTGTVSIQGVLTFVQQ